MGLGIVTSQSEKQKAVLKFGSPTYLWDVSDGLMELLESRKTPVTHDFLIAEGTAKFFCFVTREEVSQNVTAGEGRRDSFITAAASVNELDTMGQSGTGLVYFLEESFGMNKRLLYYAILGEKNILRQLNNI